MRWAGAIGPNDRVARGFHRFGVGSIIAFPPGDTFGQEHISIGDRSIIAGHVTMSAGMAPGRPLAAGAVSPVLRIGNRTLIGRGNHLVAHRSLVIGDDVITGPNVYVTDQNHTYADPEVPIGQQYPSEDPVEVGSGSWIGAGAVILPGTSLGRNTVVAAGAVVRGHFPDHAVLAGVPAKVVRHYVPGSGWQPELKDLLIEPPDDWPTPVRSSPPA
jgi:acetyltransferase-like isoleucine patch superfamily enzyme